MDEVEITNLVYRYAEHIDNGDLASAASLFRNARVLVHKDSEPLTSEELLALWESKIIIYPDGTPKTKHLITNPIVHVDREKGTATCRSYYTVTQATDSFPLQVIASGRYHDEFVSIDGKWHFAFRDYSLHDAVGDMSHHVRRHAPAAENSRPTPNKSGAASPTRTKILDAAQQIFSTMGYSEAGMRKIADMVGLSPTILFRNFSTKAALFEEALIAALGEPKPPVERDQFGRYIADMLSNSDQHICPHAMTVLSTGNEEAREIATRVLHTYALEPMAEWLGPPHAESRARQILALCAGFALYYTHFKNSPADRKDPHMVEWLAQSIQAVVDQA